jgi:hypothetical protein
MLKRYFEMMIHQIINTLISVNFFAKYNVLIRILLVTNIIISNTVKKKKKL